MKSLDEQGSDVNDEVEADVINLLFSNGVVFKLIVSGLNLFAH